MFPGYVSGFYYINSIQKTYVEDQTTQQEMWLFDLFDSTLEKKLILFYSGKTLILQIPYNDCLIYI